MICKARNDDNRNDGKHGMLGKGRERGNEQSTRLPDSEVRRYAWMREWLGGQGRLVVVMSAGRTCWEGLLKMSNACDERVGVE